MWSKINRIATYIMIVLCIGAVVWAVVEMVAGWCK